MISSAYIHIPFCNNICSYCDFCKIYYNKKYIDDYLNALNFEIESNYNGEVLKTIYIGGGTPSSLSIDELNKLFKIIKIFNINKTYEFTFECNYEDINEEFLITLKNNKVNRISIGIQTFNQKYERFLQRKVNKKKMIDAINLTKKYFDNINIDLIYGFINETISELKEDLNTILSLNIKHISTYCLILEEHTKLYINKTKEQDDETQSKMYNIIVNTLKKCGYNHYEISNFSKDGFESKHNLTYWNNDNYYGFGIGASGYIKNIRYYNTKNITKYINHNNDITKDIISNKEMIENEVMLNLRMTKGINKERFLKRYKTNFYDLFSIDFLLNYGFLVDDGKNIYISENNLFISNEIILKTLESVKE